MSGERSGSTAWSIAVRAGSKACSSSSTVVVAAAVVVVVVAGVVVFTKFKKTEHMAYRWRVVVIK